MADNSQNHIAAADDNYFTSPDEAPRAIEVWEDIDYQIMELKERKLGHTRLWELVAVARSLNLILEAHDDEA